MEQLGWNQLTMIPWVGNMLEIPLGWLLQVENQWFGHWQPLKIKDLESCENSQGGEERPRQKDFLLNSIWEEAERRRVCG